MSQVESPTYQQPRRIERRARVRPAAAGRAAGLACATELPSTIRGSSLSPSAATDAATCSARDEVAIAHVTPAASSARQRLARAGQRPRVAVELVEELARAAGRSPRPPRRSSAPAGGRGDLASPAGGPSMPIIGSSCARGRRDADLLEDGRPRLDARVGTVSTSVPSRSNMIAAGGGGERHRPYDTGPMPSELAAPLDPRSGGDLPQPRLLRRDAARGARGPGRLARADGTRAGRLLRPRPRAGARRGARSRSARSSAPIPTTSPSSPTPRPASTSSLAALRLAPGDELVVPDHAYNAARNAIAESWRTRAGARRRDAPRSPSPARPPRDRRWTRSLQRSRRRTRLVMVDHVTSPTALVLPVAEIVAELAERGIDTLVDGAHAPGMLDARPRGHRRRVLHRQLPQVDVRAQGQRLPPRPPRPPGSRPAARHQPRRELAADRSQPVPPRVRLDRHARPDAVARGTGRDRVRRRAPAGRLARTSGPRSRAGHRRVPRRVRGRRRILRRRTR